MKLSISRKQTDHLVPTPIVQQTAFWGRVHRRLGFGADAFDVSVSNIADSGDFLVLRSPLTVDTEHAYVPFGPELAPESEDMGRFLERLSLELQPHLGAHCAFIRWTCHGKPCTHATRQTSTHSVSGRGHPRASFASCG